MVNSGEMWLIVINSVWKWDSFGGLVSFVTRSLNRNSTVRVRGPLPWMSIQPLLSYYHCSWVHPLCVKEIVTVRDWVRLIVIRCG